MIPLTPIFVAAIVIAICFMVAIAVFMDRMVDVLDRRLQIIAHELGTIRARATGIECIANGFWDAYPKRKIKKEALPVAPITPETLEQKVERLLKSIEGIAGQPRTDLTPLNNAAEKTAELQAKGFQEMARFAQNLEALAQATQTNGQALGWLVEFVKKANPKAAA